MNKYTEYAHGNPLRDRRVVLDAAVLPRIKETNNICVVSAEILLERFLATLEKQTKLAVENDESVDVGVSEHHGRRPGVVQRTGAQRRMQVVCFPTAKS